MTTQTLLHLLYFLPALIVYGVWTWYSWKNKPKGKWLDIYAKDSWSAWVMINCFIIVTISCVLFILGIKYFSN